MEQTSADERGAAVTIAFLLVIGIAVIFFVFVSISDHKLEQQQKEVESHSESNRIMTQLAQNIRKSTATGLTTTATFPTASPRDTERLSSLASPTGDAAGTVSITGERDALVVSGNESGNFSLNSSFISYSSNYTFYNNAPEIRYEHQLVFQKQSSQTAFNSNSDSDGLIENRTIRYVSVQSNIQRVRAVNPQLTTTSVKQFSTTNLRNATGDTLTIALSTKVPEQTWRRSLSDELQPDGKINSIQYQQNSGTNVVTLVLESDVTYTFKRGIVSVDYPRDGRPTTNIQTGPVN